MCTYGKLCQRKQHITRLLLKRSEAILVAILPIARDLGMYFQKSGLIVQRETTISRYGRPINSGLANF